MTSNDDNLAGDRAPGLGDPTRSDDTDVPALRQGGAGRSGGDAASEQATGPAPSGGSTGDQVPAVDSGLSGPQGGQLGSAGGGYGTGSGAGTSGGTPDGEDVQEQAGPGPQTEWLRTADGTGDPRRLTIDPRDEQVADPATQTPASGGMAADDERRDLPDAEPG